MYVLNTYYILGAAQPVKRLNYLLDDQRNEARFLTRSLDSALLLRDLKALVSTQPPTSNYGASKHEARLTSISLICDRRVTTQNLAFLSYWYRKKRLQMHF